MDNGNWDEATEAWSALEGSVETYTNGVDFYNILTKNGYGIKYYTPKPGGKINYLIRK